MFFLARFALIVLLAFCTCSGASLLFLGGDFSKNPYFECFCEGETYIEDDCRRGFVCSSQTPDPYLYDGVLIGICCLLDPGKEMP